MAGRAAPLRASRPEEREAKGLASVATGSLLLADDAAAEAADWTRRCRRSAGRGARSGEHGAAEILLEAVGDIFPQLADFPRRAAVRIDLHHCSAIDHRGREVGAVVKRDRGNGAMLR